MTTLSNIFKLRSRRVFAASLLIALGSLGIPLHADWLAGQVPLRTNTHQVRDLQEKRLATLRKIVDLVDQRFRHGGASMAELILAKRNVAEAELELCTSQAERILVFERIVEDVRVLESQAAQLAQDNAASQEVALAMRTIKTAKENISNSRILETPEHP